MRKAGWLIGLALLAGVALGLSTVSYYLTALAGLGLICVIVLAFPPALRQRTLLALLALTAVIPRPLYVPEVQLAAVSLKPATLILFLADIPIFLLLLVNIKRMFRPVRPTNWLDWAIICFGVWTVVTAVMGVNVPVGMSAAFVGVKLILLYFVISRGCDPEDLEWLAKCFIVVLAGEVILGYAASAARSSFGLWSRTDVMLSMGSQGLIFRAGGTLEPNTFAEYLGFMLPLLLAYLGDQKGVRRIALFAFWCAGAGVMTLTFSRGGWVSLAVSTIVVLFQRGRRGAGQAFYGLATALVGAAFLVGLFGDVIVQRMGLLAGSIDDSAMSRLTMSQNALDIIGRYPVFGVGTNNYLEVLGNFRWYYWFPVHNKYLLVASEMGLVGGGLFVLIVWGATAFAVRQSSGIVDPLMVGATAALAGISVHMLVDIFENPVIMLLLWVFLAVIRQRSVPPAMAPRLHPQEESSIAHFSH